MGVLVLGKDLLVATLQISRICCKCGLWLDGLKRFGQIPYDSEIKPPCAMLVEPLTFSNSAFLMFIHYLLILLYSVVPI